MSRIRSNTTHSEGFEDRGLGHRADYDRDDIEKLGVHDLAAASVKIHGQEVIVLTDSRSEKAPAPPNPKEKPPAPNAPLAAPIKRKP